MNALLMLDQHDDESKRNTSELNLRQARELYTAAAASIKQTGIQLTLLEEMADVNNLAQVHAALNESELSRQWFQRLASALMLWKVASPRNEHDDDDDRSMEPNDDDDDDTEEEYDDDDDDDGQFNDFMSSVLQGNLGPHEATPAAAALFRLSQYSGRTHRDENESSSLPSPFSLFAIDVTTPNSVSVGYTPAHNGKTTRRLFEF
jgi:hypothetical protein